MDAIGGASDLWPSSSTAMSEPPGLPVFPTKTPSNDRLPDELLSYIFRLGKTPVFPRSVERSNVYSGPADTTFPSCWNYPPFQVCSSWRRAAFGTPHLFTRIWLVYLRWNQDRRLVSERILPESLERWLVCSGGLELQIRFTGFFENFTSDMTERTFALLCDHAGRWSSFAFRGVLSSSSSSLLLSALRKAFRLRYLSMNSSVGRGTDELDVPEIYLPKLQTLVIHSFIELPPIRSGVPLSLKLVEYDQRFMGRFQGVVELTLEDTSDEAVKALPKSYNLLRLNILANWESTLGPFIPSILEQSPSIQSLTIPIHLLHIRPSFFSEWRNIENIQELSLLCDTRPDGSDAADFPWETGAPDEMLDCFPSIRKLSISRESPSYPEGFTELLRVFRLKKPNGSWLVTPNLLDLELINLVVPKDELLDLAEDREETGLKITLKRCGGLVDVNDLPYKKLLKALENAVKVNPPPRPKYTLYPSNVPESDSDL